MSEPDWNSTAWTFVKGQTEKWGYTRQLSKKRTIYGEWHMQQRIESKEMRFQTKSCTSVCEQKGRCFRHIMSWFSPYRSTCVLYSKYNCWVSQKQQTSLGICIQLRGTVEAINTLIHLLVQIDFSLLKFPADPFTSWQSYWSFPLTIHENISL